MDGPQEVAADPKEILDGSMHREKPLRLGSRFEPAHLTLPLPGRLVGDFRPIVRVLVRAVDHGRHHGAVGRWVTAQFVGDQSSRDTALSFQQLPEEAEGGLPVAPRLHEHVDRVAVFVDDVFLPWVIGALRYETVNLPAGFRDIEAVVPHMTLLLRANIKLAVEGQLYRNGSGRNRGLFNISFAF